MPSSSEIRAGAAFVEIFAKDTEFAKKLAEVKGKFSQFAKELTVTGAKIAAAGIAITAPLIAMTDHFSHSGSELAQASARMGIAADSLSRLKYASEQAGVGFDALEGGVRKMQKVIFDAGNGNKAAEKSLANLGVTMADLKDKTPEAELAIFADRLAKIEDPTKRAGAAMSIFGRAGTGLLPLLNQGSDAIAALTKKADTLGITMSGQDAESAEKMERAFKDLSAATEGVSNKIGAALAPILTTLANKFASVIPEVGAFISQHNAAVGAVAGFGAGVAAVGSTLTAVGFAFQGAKNAAELFQSVISTVASASRTALNALSAMTATTAAAGAAAAGAGDAVAGAVVEVNAVTTAAEATNPVLLAFAAAAAVVGTALAVMGAKAAGAAHGISRVRAEYNAAGDALDQSTNDIKEAQDELADAKGTQEQLNAQQDLIAAYQQRARALRELIQLEKGAGAYSTNPILQGHQQSLKDTLASLASAQGGLNTTIGAGAVNAPGLEQPGPAGPEQTGSARKAVTDVFDTLRDEAAKAAQKIKSLFSNTSTGASPSASSGSGGGIFGAISPSALEGDAKSLFASLSGGASAIFTKLKENMEHTHGHFLKGGEKDEGTFNGQYAQQIFGGGGGHAEKTAENTAKTVALLEKLNSKKGFLHT
jgi:ribosomal protein S11